METYFVNTSNQFSGEQLLNLWRVTIPWLAGAATGYEIICDAAKNGSALIIELLSKHALIKEERYQRKGIFQRTSRPGMVFFKGKADQDLGAILLSGPLPDKSIPADISPCQQVLLYRNDALLFSCYDYGVFQTICFSSPEEAQTFMDGIKNANIPAEILEKK